MYWEAIIKNKITEKQSNCNGIFIVPAGGKGNINLKILVKKYCRGKIVMFKST